MSSPQAEQLLAQRWEGQVPGFQRLLPAGIDKHIEFTALLMMDNQRSVRLTLQVIILAERHNTQNTGLVQGPAAGEWIPAGWRHSYR